MTEGIRELSAEAIVRLGGWHPGYARVRLIAQDDHHAVVLVDGNGDDSELELEYWHRDQDGLWYGGSSSGYGSLATMRTQTWTAGDFVAALGRAEPGSEITIEFGGRTHRRLANKSGAWGFVHTTGSGECAELPVVAAVRPPP